jgi:hypothetical protein
MTKKIIYTSEPLGKVEVIADFLPPPAEFAFHEEGVKVTNVDPKTDMTDSLNREIETRVAAYHRGEMQTYALEDVLEQAKRIAP